MLFYANSYFQSFRDPKNTNVVENMVKALARVVSSVQVRYGVLFFQVTYAESLLHFAMYIFVHFFQFLYVVKVKNNWLAPREIIDV